MNCLGFSVFALCFLLGGYMTQAARDEGRWLKMHKPSPTDEEQSKTLVALELA